MSVEQYKPLQQEAIKHNETKIVFPPPTTLSGLLNTTFSEPEGLNLYSSSLHFVARQITSDTKEYVGIFDEALHKNKLLSMLIGAARNPNFSTITAMIEDLEMPDRRDQKSQDLLARHVARFPESWQHLEKHRGLILSVLKSEDQDPESPYLSALRTEAKVKEDLFNHGLQMRSDALWEFFLPEEEEEAEFKERVVQFAKSSLHGRRKKRYEEMEADEVIRSFSRWNMGNRGRLLKQFLLECDDDTRAKLLQRYIRSCYTCFETPNINGGEVYIKRNFESVKEVEQQPSGRISLNYDNYSAQAEPIEEKNAVTKYRILPETVRYRHFIIPTIRWTTSNAKRKWNLDTIEDKKLVDSTYPFLQKHAISELNGIDMKRFDSPLGPSVAAYFATEVRESWAKYLGLSEGGKLFPMGAMQSLILALESRDELLRHPFFEAAENYVKRTTMV